MADDRDPPIEPQNFLSGMTVIDFGDVRVARGLSRRHHSSCPHLQLVYDKDERRIWCKTCEHDVEAFDAFSILVTQYDAAFDMVVRRETAVKEAEKFQARLIATKRIEEAWRHKNMVPACPHCGNGIFPEDIKKGMTMLGKDYARAKIGRSTKP